MNSGLFGEGSLALGWLSVDGIAGLRPRLAIKGQLIAKGYGIGSVVSISADVSAWEIEGSHAHLGATSPRSYVLNWVKQQWVQENPPPPDETIWETEIHLPLDTAVIEGLEERRQGKEFYLQVDTTILMVDRGIPLVAPADPPVHYQVHPTMTYQDRLRITQNDWNEVLSRWDRGVNIPILVPLPELHPDQSRAAVVRHLRYALQKIDGSDYSGSIAESRKALELLRKLSPATTPLPKNPQDRNAMQRIHAIIDALFGLASAPAHVDDVVADFQPIRADAVSIAASTAAIAQEIFAHLKLL